MNIEEFASKVIDVVLTHAYCCEKAFIPDIDTIEYTPQFDNYEECLKDVIKLTLQLKKPLSKEVFFNNTTAEEVFSIFSSIFERIKQKRKNRNLKIPILTDLEIYNAICDVIKNYAYEK